MLQKEHMLTDKLYDLHQQRSWDVICLRLVAWHRHSMLCVARADHRLAIDLSSATQVRDICSL